MPDVQEVFRLATSKVQPDPDALERQVRRQRAAARKSRVRAYVAVAAVLVVLGVAVFAISRAVRRNEVTPDQQGTTTQTDLTFLQALPPGATPQTPAIVDLGGKQTSRIDGVPLDAYAPSLTSDGTQMAFVAAPNELGYNQIGVIHTDGTGAHFIITPQIMVDGVAISPDGTRIAFEGETDGAFSDIYVVNSDGTGLRQLTTDPATDQYPAWSPDGKTIAYDNAGASEQTQDPQFSKSAEIFTVPADGGPIARLTHNNGSDAAPSYSPDGKTIVDQSTYGFSMMDPNGGHYRGFSIGAPSAFTPRFSPDGKTIAFTYYKDVPRRPTPQFGVDLTERPVVILAIVDAATRKVTKLTHVGIASDLNTPQWVDDKHILVMRVPANGV
jgi:Tol biopolymer transport system component